MHNISREARVGVVAALAIFCFAFMMVFLKALKVSAPGDIYYVVFDDAGRVIKGTDVFLAGVKVGEVLDEGSRLDRAVGDGVGLVRPGDRLEDVVHAVVGGIDAGEERRPRSPRVRRDGRLQNAALPARDKRLQVRQRALFQQGIEDAPIRAIPTY